MTVKWIGKRMVMGTIVLLIVSFLSFFIMHAAPGDPATAFYGGNAQTLNAAEKERISRVFSLDRPVIAQYGAWLSGNSKREFRRIRIKKGGLFRPFLWNGCQIHCFFLA